MASSRTAVVTGASRGAGKAIALELARAGWTVVVTARSTRTSPSPEGVGGTVDETAEAIRAAGGTGIAVRCDHASEVDLQHLEERVKGEYGGLDLLVNSAWGGYEHHDLEAFGRPFWEQPTNLWDRMFTSGVRPTLLTSARLAPLMMERKHGVVINLVAWLQGGYLGNLYYDTAKSAIIRMTEGMAQELRPHGVAAITLVPGFMRTERVMASHAVHPFDLSSTESPAYLGRAVVALGSDPDVLTRSGHLLYVGDLAKVYGFTDVDGTQPPQFRAGDLEAAYGETGDSGVARSNAAPPRIYRLLLPATDLDQSQRFYSDLLGTPGRQVGGGRIYFDCGPVLLGILDYSTVREGDWPKPTEAVYLATDDVEGVYERARGLGCLSTELIHNDPKNPAGEIVVRPWGERSFYAVDPSGNPLCFVDARTLFTGTPDQVEALARAHGA